MEKDDMATVLGDILERISGSEVDAKLSMSID
jgi:hypothetical protein